MARDLPPDLGVEVVAVGQRPVDPGGAEHAPAHLHAVVVAVLMTVLRHVALLSNGRPRRTAARRQIASRYPPLVRSAKKSPRVRSAKTHRSSCRTCSGHDVES